MTWIFQCKNPTSSPNKVHCSLFILVYGEYDSQRNCNSTNGVKHIEILHSSAFRYSRTASMNRWTHCIHRYLISRLSLQVFYLWRHVSSTSRPFILWWPNLELLFAPLHRSSPFIRGLRCQAIQTENSPYITERTPKAVYIVRCLWLHRIFKLSVSILYWNEIALSSQTFFV
jgi:hypothetical protein